MPTQKPRIAVTLDPVADAALQGLAEAIGKPKATLAADLILEMVPQLEGLTKIALAGKRGNKAAAKRALAHMFGDAFAEMATLQQGELIPSSRKRHR